MTLAVIGDRAGPAALGNLLIPFYLPRSPIERLIEPDRQTFEDAMLRGDRLWFWGHGNGGGLWIRKGEFFGPNDVRRVAAMRASKLDSVTLRACHSVGTADAVDAWLQIARVVHGFSGVTMEPWGRVRPMLTFRQPIAYNPRDLERASGW